MLDQVSDKWGVAVFAVLEDRPRRFNEIRRCVGTISHRVLTRKLRDLERDGFVSRTVHPVRPPHVEYAITPLGRSLLTVVRQFMTWTIGASPGIRRARDSFDRAATTAQPPRNP